MKLTEPDSDHMSNLRKAINAIDKMVKECDEKVNKMKQIEQLVCLEMLLDFGKVKSVPLVISSRYLVRQGPVKRLAMESTYNPRTSFINVFLHIFNDLLIVSTKKEQRFVVEDHAEFPSNVNVEPLKTKTLGLPPYSFLLHLSENHSSQPAALILVFETRSEKEAWMKVLSPD
ncbi:rho guanine nucleotide exchange factor 16 [Gouania willdenowi]|uniref:rho guanine nucleotide exchange factor 16 n=1 Tax=Gouania willdenowi TaxID=441366 RepID=UPI001055637D|nr:rho guanine nucleotide exchange factor 16-like [Gouania willdenowi]